MYAGLSMSYLDEWNAMEAPAAAQAVLPCCGSEAWADGLAARRPLGSLPELLAASDTAWWSLTEEDWREAFDSHPRIGEQHPQGTSSETGKRWSSAEQSGLDSEHDVTARIAQGNRAYEERFDRIFLIRAAGRSAEQMLEELRRRIGNTPEAELRESAEQQREITHLRLQRWLAEHEAGPRTEQGA